MASVQRWCRVTVHRPGGSAPADLLADILLEGTGPPDIGTVNEIARLALVARRAGATISLSEVAPAMEELLELAGLRLELLQRPEPEGGRPLGADGR
jgi:hypothetical protein